MKNLVNHVQLIGNLGTAPEMKTFDNNKLIRFSLATNEGYRNQKGEWVDETVWHNIVAWGKLAENMEGKLEKGTRLAVTGKISNRNYQNASGEKKYITEIVVREYLVIPKKEASAPADADMPF